MIKVEKNVTTVGIEVRDAGEKNEISVVVVGNADDIMAATAHLLADLTAALGDSKNPNEQMVILGKLCGVTAGIIYKDKEPSHG